MDNNGDKDDYVGDDNNLDNSNADINNEGNYIHYTVNEAKDGRSNIGHLTALRWAMLIIAAFRHTDVIWIFFFNSRAHI